MKSSATTEFWRLYRELPEPIRAATRPTYRIYEENPRASSLHFKKVRDAYSIRIDKTAIALSPLMCQMGFSGFRSGRTTNTSVCCASEHENPRSARRHMFLSFLCDLCVL
jgi:hypothetical protein